MDAPALDYSCQDDERPSLFSRFGRRAIVLLTLGLVGPCGVGGAAAGSSTGVMALRFLLGFLLAGVNLGVYLMRESLPLGHSCLSLRSLWPGPPLRRRPGSSVIGFNCVES